MIRDIYAELGQLRYTQLAEEAQDFAHEDTGTLDELVEVLAHPADISPTWYCAARRDHGLSHEDAMEAGAWPDGVQRVEYIRRRVEGRTHAEAVAMGRPSLADRTPR